MEWVVLGIQAFINLGLLTMIMVNHYGIGGMPVYVRRTNRFSTHG